MVIKYENEKQEMCETYNLKKRNNKTKPKKNRKKYK